MHQSFPLIVFTAEINTQKYVNQRKTLLNVTCFWVYGYIPILLKCIQVSLTCVLVSPTEDAWRDTRKPCEERRNKMVFKRNKTSFLLKRRPFLMTVAGNHSWIISTICVISHYMYCIWVKVKGLAVATTVAKQETSLTNKLILASVGAFCCCVCGD